VVGITLSKDESTFVVGRGQGEIQLWQPGLLASFGMFGVVPGMANVANLHHGSPISQISSSEDGNIIATVGTARGMSASGAMIIEPNVVRVWNLRERREIARITSWDQILSVVTPDGGYLLTGQHVGDIARTSEPSLVKVWRLSGGIDETVTATLAVPDALAVAVSLDGRTVAAKSQDGTLRAWAGGTMKYSGQRATTPVAKSSSSLCELFAPLRLAFSQDGGLLADGDGRAVRIHALTGNHAPAVLKFDGDVCAATLSNNGKFLATSLPPGETARDSQPDATKDGSEKLVTHVREIGGRSTVFGNAGFSSFVLAVSNDGRKVLTQRLMQREDFETEKNPLRRVSGAPWKPTIDVWERDSPSKPVFSLAIAEVMAPASASFSSDARLFVIQSGVVASVHTASDGSKLAEIELARVEPGQQMKPFQMKPFRIMRLGFDNDDTQLRAIALDGSTQPYKLLASNFPWRPEALVKSICSRLSANEREITPAERLPFFGSNAVKSACGDEFR
jgi:WD40 repeat protein